MRKLNRCVREFPTRQLAASIDVSVSARIPLTASLNQEPGAPLGLVDPDFDQAGSGDITMLIADVVSLT
jgi:hypothetical protein